MGIVLERWKVEEVPTARDCVLARDEYDGGRYLEKILRSVLGSFV